MGMKIGAEVRQVDRMINLPNGGSVQVRSADDPNSLRGEGLDLVVMDEVAFTKEEAWTEALRPALSDRQGKALFISTPKGHNWFWRNYQRGLNDGEEWASFTFPTSSNPYIAPGEIEAARLSLPERVYQQEYLAVFVDDAGGIFRHVMEAATAQEQTLPLEGHQYIGGVDVASMVDFTVCSVIDVTTSEMVYMDRFNRIDYTALEDRLAAIHKRYRMTTMVIEDNSIGRPVLDHMSSRGANVSSFTTTNATKQAIIQHLQAAFEHGRIKILNDPILIGELQAYEGTQMSSGWKYSAPEGLHDDCVMSLAIAWWSASRKTPAVVQPESRSKWTGMAGENDNGSRWRI
jgi:phage terminase large subunit-like protein